VPLEVEPAHELSYLRDALDMRRDPRVPCDTLIRDDGALFAVLASHAAEQLTVKPALPRGGELTSLGGEETAEGVELGPFGIRVLTVTGSAVQAKPRPM
jgi:hypothetical protein